MNTPKQEPRHACNNRRIHLQFDSVLVVAEQMTATENMLEEAEVNFYRPAIFIYCSDGLRLEIETVRCYQYRLSLPGTASASRTNPPGVGDIEAKRRAPPTAVMSSKTYWKVLRQST